MKQIQTLKKEKETLAHTFEQEEECLTNDLSRKLNKVGINFIYSFMELGDHLNSSLIN